jgi:DNA-binding MarR family transcriptional regulator
MNKPPDLIPLIIADIYELAGLFRARGEAIAATIDQTQARWQVLSAASATPPLTVPRIARRLGVTRQAVQRIADLLAREGLAEFADNPDHKSSPHLMLTRQGEAALARLGGIARGTHDALAETLTNMDLAALRRDLRALLVALNGPPKFERGE